MPDPARSAIIRRLDEIIVTIENHGIEEDFFNSRVCYINRITDPPGYFPYGYKASKARRNSKAWMEISEEEYQRYFRPWWQQKKQEQRNREEMEKHGYGAVYWAYQRYVCREQER